MITTIINLLNAAQWQAWGHEPSFALGHSVGEVAAASVAGLLTIEQALHTASKLGEVRTSHRYW
jgi:acyl transferase domain-containing protein